MKKSVNVYIPEGKSVFYANYRVKINDGLRGVRSVQRNRSTGSPDRRTAQAIGNRMRDQDLMGLFDVLPKLREDCVTCGAIVDRWTERCKLRSKRRVALDFLQVVAEGAGLRGSQEATEKARAIKLSALTKGHMLAFRDRATSNRVAVTTNRMMRSARSMFSRRAREFYHGMRLPDLSGWLGISCLKVEKDRRFRRIDEGTLNRMDTGAIAIWRLARRKGLEDGVRWRNAWATYWLMRRCGLRNDEVVELRWEWFSLRDGKVWLDMIDRTYWHPKGSAGQVPVAADLYKSLLHRFGPARPGPEGFVLEGSRSARWDGAHREVNVYVRRFLPQTSKGAYQLRKQWGSEMARRYGLETAAKLLRHADIKTAWEHYSDDLKLRDVEAA